MKRKKVNKPHSGDNSEDEPGDDFEQAIASFIVATEEYKRSRHEKAHNALKKFVPELELAGIVLLAAYTAITLLLLCTSQQQLSVSRDQEVRQLRAYVGPTYNSFGLCCPSCQQPITKPQAVPECIPGADYVPFIVKNYGTTPAERPVVCANVKAFSTDENPDARAQLTFNKCDEHAATVNPSIWPGEERAQEAHIEDPASLGAAGNRRIYLFARLRYFDVFGDVRNTYICRKLVFNAGEFRYIGCNIEIHGDD